MYVPFKNLQVMYLCCLKMESQTYKKIGNILAVFKPVLKFHYHNGKQSCRFFAVHSHIYIYIYTHSIYIYILYIVHAAYITSIVYI